MAPPKLSTLMLSRLTGASPRMLDYWARTRLLPPSAQDAKGKGSRRQYTFQDLIAALTICKLRERKCPFQQIRTAIRYLKAHYPESTQSETLSRLTLITDGTSVYMLTDERQVMEIVTRQWVWSVPLGLLIAEASQRIKAIPQEWTETIKVNGGNYRLLVSHDSAEGEYVVECRALPGLMQRAKTPAAAIGNGRKAIASLMTFRKSRRRRASKVSHAAG